jgi:hypothetical protein
MRLVPCWPQGRESGKCVRKKDRDSWERARRGLAREGWEGEGEGRQRVLGVVGVGEMANVIVSLQVRGFGVW